MLTCVVNGCNDPKFALPLTKEDGKWVVKPVCAECKAALMSEAYHEGKSIRFFSLTGSLAEAERRNANAHKLTPFLTAFAREIEARPVIRKNGDKRNFKAKVAVTARP